MDGQISKRAVAYKYRIGDILKGKPILENERLSFVEVFDKQVIRVNVIANVIDRYENSPELGDVSDPSATPKKAYLSLTLDDASGQIRTKSFAEDVEKFKDIMQGSTVAVIGVLRFYNNEIYIQPEVMKISDPRYLLIRKFESEKSMPKEIKKEVILQVKDKILEIIKNSEADGGIDVEKIVMQLKEPADLINQEIQKFLEEGLAYEPRPGRIRYLG